MSIWTSSTAPGPNRDGHTLLTPAAILAERLPRSLLAPGRLFRRIHHNSRPGGGFVRANHGHPETTLADVLCTAVGLRRLSQLAEPRLLSLHRASPAIHSCWTRPSISRTIRINQQFAVISAAAREFLLGPFLVTAPLRRHLDHNPQSRFLRSRWLAFPLKNLWADVTG
jgi:hypothetical protein